MAKFTDLPEEIRQRIFSLAVVNDIPFVGEISSFTSPACPARKLIRIRKTCRFFYQEALPAFWSANTWAFYVYSGMGARQHGDVAAFFTRVARHQVQWIQNLRFYVELPCTITAPPPSRPPARQRNGRTRLEFLSDLSDRYESSTPTCTKHIDIKLANPPRVWIAPGFQHGCKHEETVLKQLSDVLATVQVQNGRPVVGITLIWSLIVACSVESSGLQALQC